MAKKKRGRKGGSRGKGIFSSIIAVILVLAMSIAVCRMLGIHDVQSLIDFARSTVSPTRTLSNKAIGKADEKANCNVLNGDSCSSDPFDKSESGDSNSNDHATSSPPSETSPTPSTPPTAANPLTQQLDSIQVANADKSSYSRSSYPHWITQSGTCDTRETILKNVGFDSDTKTCVAKSKSGFTYTEPYGGKKISNPSSLDIDHVIPLKYANSHNGASWSTAKKTQFANDMSQLIAVDASANRQKGDSGPSGWMPSNKNETCSYTTIWITTASRYGISITSSDKTALQKGIESCS